MIYELTEIYNFLPHESFRDYSERYRHWDYYQFNKTKIMEIKLNKQEHELIAEQIADRFDSTYIEIELCNLKLSLTYNLEKIGYIEDDYSNGTGAFICTDVEFRLHDISAINIDAEIDYSEKWLDKAIRKILID